MTDANQALPIAGWYPDPEDDKSDRWWNGTMWSDHRRVRTSAAPVAPAAAAAAAAPVGAGIPVPSDTPAADPAAAASVVNPADGSDFARPNPYANPAPAAPVYGGAPVYGQQPGGYAAQSPYQAPQQYAPYAYAPAEPRNGMAIAALITALSAIILPFVINPLVGAVLGFLALNRSKQLAATGQINTGRGMAIAAIITGLVLGIGSLLLYILIGVSISMSNSSTYY